MSRFSGIANSDPCGRGQAVASRNESVTKYKLYFIPLSTALDIVHMTDECDLQDKVASLTRINQETDALRKRRGRSVLGPRKHDALAAPGIFAF